MLTRNAFDPDLVAAAEPHAADCPGRRIDRKELAIDRIHVVVFQHPIRLSTIELIEIGAGGGSIARRDEIGLLKVGPDSAGSEPGPACFGGGDRIVLGTPGGGGYGSANLRSTADREGDQKMGYVER